MFDNFLKFDLSPEVISSLIVMGIIIIFSIVIGIMARFHDPLKKPKGLLFLAEIGVEFFDNLTKDMIGTKLSGFGGFIMAIAVYLFLSFIFGLTGLPSPITNMAVPLSLGLISFFTIHFISIRYTKWRYFKRYIEPFPIFLPVNLLSMWAPLLSLTLRLFGNALSGWVLMNIVYYALENLSTMIFGSLIPSEWSGIFIAPLIAPVLHVYFDLFSALIQTTIFISLTTIFVGQEIPDEDEISSSDTKFIREGGN